MGKNGTRKSLITVSVFGMYFNIISSVNLNNSILTKVRLDYELLLLIGGTYVIIPKVVSIRLVWRMEEIMSKYIKELDISYETLGQGKPFIIFHGWGCSKEMFKFLLDHYKNKYKVYAFDLPGFGGSKEPKSVMNTEAYCDRMIEALEYLGIENPIGLGHSFGGRILIKMSTKIKFDKLILTGSAGVVDPKPLRYYVKVYTYKGLKKCYKIGLVKKLFPTLLDKYRKNAGSADYNNASEMMKQVLSVSVNEDIRGDFSKVTVPTLLIWGDKDSATPLSHAKLMEKEMQDAGLVIFEGGTHFAFLEQGNRFLTVLDAFI